MKHGTLMDSVMDNVGHEIIRNVNKSTKVLGLVWDLTWNNCVRNTHCAPRGHQTNWYGINVDKDGTPIPIGYPGWTGRVWIRYETTPLNFKASGLLRETCLYTGTGGSGSYNGIWSKLNEAHHISGSRRNNAPACYSWDCTLFAADWPAMQNIHDEYEYMHQFQLAQYEKDKAWAILNNKDVDPFERNPLTHKFEWEDIEQSERDKEFLANCWLN